MQAGAARCNWRGEKPPWAVRRALPRAVGGSATPLAMPTQRQPAIASLTQAVAAQEWVDYQTQAVATPEWIDCQAKVAAHASNAAATPAAAPVTAPAVAPQEAPSEARWKA